MKSRTLTPIIATTLFAVLAIPVPLAAQHTRYKLIDIDTLGGPAAIGQVDGTGISQFINNPGVVVGGIGLVQLGPSKFFLALMSP